MTKYALVLTTVPDKETGRKIAHHLTEEKLAACVTISGACKSYFRWQGETSEEQEYILLIKTKATLFPELEEKIRKIHPYEVPEIIAVPLIKGYSKYLNWIDKETKG